LDNELLIYLGVGKSLSPSILSSLSGIDHSGARSLTSGNVLSPLKNMIKIPTDDMETQDYIAMSDLVVSKTGYSTASESIRGNAPMLLFRREGYEEDKLVAGGIEKLRIGKEISEQEFLSGDWLDYINDLHNYKEGYNSLNDRFKKDGIAKATEFLEALLS
jgi:predicted glycosyltransferase